MCSSTARMMTHENNVGNRFGDRCSSGVAKEGVCVDRRASRCVLQAVRGVCAKALGQGGTWLVEQIDARVFGGEKIG